MSAMTLRASLEGSLEAGSPEAALASLVAARAELLTDAESAQLALDFLHDFPKSPGLVGLVEALAEAHAGDAVVLAMSARALVAHVDARPRDEPPLDGAGPERKAEALCVAARALPALSADPALASWVEHLRANALRLAGPERDDEAQAAFAALVAADGQDGHLWFDLALLHKWRGRFQAGFEANLRAQSRLGDSRAILFNLGICATAIGDGNVAGLCWKKLGFTPSLNEKSGHAFVPDLPPMQVRVLSRPSGYGFGDGLPDGAVGFELLWVQPLSPVHGVVVSPCFRDAPIDYGDVVLWDGAPVAFEASDGGKVPVFPVLEVLRRGDERRFRFVALEQHDGDVAGLEAKLPAGVKVAVQRARVERLCSLCAAGDTMRKHEHLPAEEHRIVYGKLLVPADVDPHTLVHALDSALREGGRVRLAVPALYELLGNAKRAGQEHQAFRGIEQAAIKKGLVS